MTKWRRFEVMLPLRFNDGEPVPDEWIGSAAREIAEHFGASSYETQVIQGLWKHGEVTYEDYVVRIVVDVPDSAKNRRWMKEFKKRWKERMQQLEIWMVSHPIDIE